MYWRILPHAVVALALTVGLAAPAHAAPSLAEIQAKVRFLEEEATTAAEGAQEAKVKLIALTRTLNGIKAKAAVQGETLSALQKSLGTIAIEQYKAGGLGQSLELSFPLTQHFTYPQLVLSMLLVGANLPNFESMKRLSNV